MVSEYFPVIVTDLNADETFKPSEVAEGVQLVPDRQLTIVELRVSLRP